MTDQGFWKESRFITEDTPGKIVLDELEVQINKVNAPLDPSTSTLPAGDNINLFTVPANTIISELKVLVTKVDIGGGSRTIDIGILATPNQFLGQVDLKVLSVPGNTIVSPVAAGIFYKVETTIVANVNEALTDAKFVVAIAYRVLNNSLT